MSHTLQYLTLEEVLYLHDRIIKRTGGRPGIRDLALLEAAIARPALTFGGEDLYPDLFSKAAALLSSLVGNHPFIDGNKRTAYAAAVRFAFVNGHAVRAARQSVVRLLLDVAARRRSLDEVTLWLRSHSRPLRAPPPEMR